MLFHKQIRGPLANSLFHHRPATAPRLKSKPEAAFHKADDLYQWRVSTWGSERFGTVTLKGAKINGTEVQVREELCGQLKIIAAFENKRLNI